MITFQSGGNQALSCGQQPESDLHDGAPDMVLGMLITFFK